MSGSDIEAMERIAVLENQMESIMLSLKEHKNTTKQMLDDLNDTVLKASLNLVKIKWSVIGFVAFYIISDIGLLEFLKKLI